VTTRIEYGSKDAADAARDRHREYLYSDDDRRLLTVAYSDADTPDHVLDAERLEAADSRGESAEGAGQVPLSDNERDQIDFSRKRANIPHAKAVKGIAQSEGVEDWVSYYDGTLTVDEHREVMADASRESGKRTEEETIDEKVGRAARAAQSNQCDHARGHCENGDAEACEFLQATCDYEQEEIDQLLSDPRTADETEQVTIEYEGEEIAVSPETAGALRRSWGGYKTATSDLESALAAVRDHVINARQAWRAINRIREANEQDQLHPDRLHTLLDALAGMPGSIPEVRTLAHYGSDEHEQAVEGADSGTEAGNEQVIAVEESAQFDLTGERERPNQQTELAVEADTRTAQGRESTAQAPVNQGGLLADERDDPSMSAESTTESTDQQQFRDPEQGTLSDS